MHETLYAGVVRPLRRRLETLTVGDPFEPATDLGPLISESAALRVEAQVAAMRSAGGVGELGGRRRGNYIWPTLITDLDPRHPAALEEIFGPVLPVYPFSDLAEAAESVNAAPYGLQAGVFTNSLDTVKFLFGKLEVGTLA